MGARDVTEAICTRCGQAHEVEDCPVPSTYELPADMESVTTGSSITFDNDDTEISTWPLPRTH